MQTVCLSGRVKTGGVLHLTCSAPPGFSSRGGDVLRAEAEGEGLVAVGGGVAISTRAAAALLGAGRGGCVIDKDHVSCTTFHVQARVEIAGAGRGGCCGGRPLHPAGVRTDRCLKLRVGIRAAAPGRETAV